MADDERQAPQPEPDGGDDADSDDEELGTTAGDAPTIDPRFAEFRRTGERRLRNELVEATTDYSGAELEQVVVASLYDAFDTGNDLTTEGLLATLRDIVPLAITMREQIESMREWARTRARMAATRGRIAPKKEGWMARYGAPTANLGDKGPEPDDGERKLEL